MPSRNYYLKERRSEQRVAGVYTTDAIFIIHPLTEKPTEYNRLAFMCFTDPTQAYDRVRVKDVVTISSKRKLDPNTIAAIRELNTSNSTFITN